MPTVCAFGCWTSPTDGAQCLACEANTRSCRGDLLVTCDADGLILAEETCAFGCSERIGDDGCNQCTPSTTTCDGADRVVCGGDGLEVSRETCTYGCDSTDGRCDACAPKTTECSGDEFVTCDGAGNIVSAEDCLDGADACNEGRCTSSGCARSPLTGVACDDGSNCTAMSECRDGTCVRLQGVDCDDGNPCTVDRCAPSTGACSNDEPPREGETCGDRSVCRTGLCTPFDDDNCGACGRSCVGATGGCKNGNCVSTGDLVITELLVNANDGNGDMAGEYIEICNPTSEAIDIRGWTLRDDGTDNHTILDVPFVPLLVPAGSFAVLAQAPDYLTLCGADALYKYADLSLGNSGDEVELALGSCVVDRVVYPASFDVVGVAQQLSADAMDATSNDDIGAWCNTSTSPFPNLCNEIGSPGAANEVCAP